MTKPSPDQIATWKAQPLPYCVTRTSPKTGLTRPLGKARYATLEQVSDVAMRRETFTTGLTLFVDFAGVYDREAA